VSHILLSCPCGWTQIIPDTAGASHLVNRTLAAHMQTHQPPLVPRLEYVRHD
jgi:hypothetical protein